MAVSGMTLKKARAKALEAVWTVSISKTTILRMKGARAIRVTVRSNAKIRPVSLTTAQV